MSAPLLKLPPAMPKKDASPVDYPTSLFSSMAQQKMIGAQVAIPASMGCAL
jgi:hypothetical protein